MGYKYICALCIWYFLLSPQNKTTGPYSKICEMETCSQIISQCYLLQFLFARFFYECYPWKWREIMVTVCVCKAFPSFVFVSLLYAHNKKSEKTPVTETKQQSVKEGNERGCVTLHQTRFIRLFKFILLEALFCLLCENAICLLA